MHSSNLQLSNLQEQQLDKALVSRKRRASETSNLTTDTARATAAAASTPTATTTASLLSNSAAKRSRDLLTEEERRANHIASEQKRRNTIRTGFKDLTDIIPTLKNINNSKSTILFKAAEYIKHLEKRNRGLRDKLISLQLRLEVETRLGRSFLRRHSTSMNHQHSQQQHHRNHPFHHPSHVCSPSPSCSTPVPSSSSSSSSSTLNHALTPEAYAALMAHRKQQKHLELLQEHLRLQQELLAAQHKLPPHYFSSAIVMPAEDKPSSSPCTLMNAPSLNIPADEDFNRESVGRERLLSFGKLKHLYPASSSSSSSSRH